MDPPLEPGLSTHVTRVTLKHPPVSYAAIAESPDYNWPLSALPPGVLADFDLPDCYRALKAKDIETSYDRGVRGRPISLASSVACAARKGSP